MEGCGSSSPRRRVRHEPWRGGAGGNLAVRAGHAHHAGRPRGVSRGVRVRVRRPGGIDGRGPRQHLRRRDGMRHLERGQLRVLGGGRCGRERELPPRGHPVPDGHHAAWLTRALVAIHARPRSPLCPRHQRRAFRCAAGSAFYRECPLESGDHMV
eukprot:scaffold864_cov181-Pinguiococcus_pyrenoidosus.AAC.3